MFDHLLSVLALLLFSENALAEWTPTCGGWNDCMHVWDGSSCQSTTGWDCICGNDTAISQINTCVATSCTDISDQEAIYGAIAQVCANAGTTLTHSAEATFDATSGGSLLATVTGGPGYGPSGNWGAGDWDNWVSVCSDAIGTAPSGWNGQGGWGNWQGGDGRWGGNGGWTGSPWGTKASDINCDLWTTWTAGWGPYSSWTGTWSGCSTTTAEPEPATVTTTITESGQTQTITGTTFGIQVGAVSTSTSGGVGETPSGAMRIFDLPMATICGTIAAAIIILMLAL